MLNRTIHRFASLRTATFVAMLVACMAGAPAFAAPVDLAFLPPQLPAQQVCIARRTDREIIASWTDWQGEARPNLGAEDIISDARRLRDINANGYFDLIVRMLDLAESLPAKKAADLDVDRINLYLKAGRVQDLKAKQLVSRLEADPASLTPKAAMVLSDLYKNGTVVSPDPERGQQLLVRAALGGSSDALLELAKRSLAGERIPGWTMAPKVAIAMAFGSLVGQLDPDICARLDRIGREYARGEAVVQNYDIAEKWYRLAADLGDPDSAWKVAEMHLDSELIVKDNETLLKYLSIAADRGVALAQVELGKLYGAGALVPQDVSKAQHYFEAASAQGTRSGLIQLIGYLEPRIEGDADREHFNSALEELIDLPEAPGWAFGKRARQVLADRGRWAAADEATQLLEKGIALGDPDSAQMLADILLRHPERPGNFERALGLLSFAVDHGSKSDSMPRMRNAYLCRAPRRSDFAMADYWQANVDAASNATETLTDGDIARLVKGENFGMLATLQTHALYGRPTAVASYRDYLIKVGADAETLAFWERRAESDPVTVATIARRELKGEQDKLTVADALQRLRAANDEGLASAQLDLASVLIDRYPGDTAKTEEGMALLDLAAKRGSGEAMLRLLALEDVRGITRQQIYEQYAGSIDAAGDADALIFGAVVVGDPAKRADYIERAISLADCTFESAYRFAQLYSTWGETTEAEHWAEVALHLVADNSRQYGTLADLFASLPAPQFKQQATQLYQKAVDLGDGTSFDRLLKMYVDESLPTYSPRRAVELVRTTLETASVPMIQFVLGKIEDMPSNLRQTLLRDVSLVDLYRKPAEAGDVDAILALAKYLQDTGTPDNGAAAAQWLQKAADRGEPRALVALAKAYALGTGVEISPVKARDLLQLAAAKGSNEAQKLLANMAS